MIFPTPLGHCIIETLSLIKKIVLKIDPSEKVAWNTIFPVEKSLSHWDFLQSKFASVFRNFWEAFYISLMCVGNRISQTGWFFPFPVTFDSFLYSQ